MQYVLMALGYVCIIIRAPILPFPSLVPNVHQPASYSINSSLGTRQGAICMHVLRVLCKCVPPFRKFWGAIAPKIFHNLEHFKFC